MLRPERPVDFRWQRPVSDLLTRCANVPSRADMVRPQLKADLAENVSRTYDAVWRRARATHGALIDTTWDKFAVACGYSDDTDPRTSLRRYLDLLSEAGLLTYSGAKNSRGQWKCLHIELLEPPATLGQGRSSSAGQATFACEARRRYETPQQTVARRRQPWRRCGGRRDAVARHSLLWSRNVATPFSETAPDSVWGRSSPDAYARARGRDASHAIAAPSRAPAPNGGDEREGSAAERRAQRRERRRRARLDRFGAENVVFAESRRLRMALEDPAAAPLGPSVDDLARWAAEVGYTRRLR